MVRACPARTGIRLTPGRRCRPDLSRAARSNSCAARSPCRSAGIPAHSRRCNRAPRCGRGSSADRRRSHRLIARIDPQPGRRPGAAALRREFGRRRDRGRVAGALCRRRAGQHRQSSHGRDQRQFDDTKPPHPAPPHPRPERRSPIATVPSTLSRGDFLRIRSRSSTMEPCGSQQNRHRSPNWNRWLMTCSPACRTISARCARD